MYSSSVLLNLLGMQWYRILFFYLRRVLRVPKKIEPQYRGYLEALERDGVAIIPNFFSEETYRRLREEYQKLSAEFRRDHSEIPIPHVNRLSIYDRRVSEEFRAVFTGNQLIKNVARAFLNREYHLPIDAYLTRIYCNQEEVKMPSNGGTNNLHFDAPLRVFKAFYYFNDVDERNAALRYCIGSQKRNSLKRLLLEYKLSVRYALNKWNPNHQGEYADNEPWVKISDQEINDHNLQEKVMVVKANTLVLMNPGGFHRRGTFLEAGERQTVEINFRNAESLRNDLYPLERKLRTS